MSLYYLDSSALVKLYVKEHGTDRMLELASAGSGSTLAIAAVSRVEYRAAVRRRQRSGDIPASAAEALLDRFEGHLAALYLVQPITDAVLEDAIALVDRHQLRAYDAVQLAGCRMLLGRARSEPPVFVCSDQQLIGAARQEGLSVLDPTV